MLANRQQQSTRLLACWQGAAPVVPSRAELVAFPARYARVATFGVRQPRCRASRARDLARVRSLTRLVTRMPGVLVTIMEAVGNECNTFLVDVFLKQVLMPSHHHIPADHKQKPY